MASRIWVRYMDPETKNECLRPCDSEQSAHFLAKIKNGEVIRTAAWSTKEELMQAERMMA